MKSGIKTCARCKAYDDIGCNLRFDLEYAPAVTWWYGQHMSTAIHKPKNGSCLKPLTNKDFRIMLQAKFKSL